MSITSTVKCDVCGKTADAGGGSSSVFGIALGGLPLGWFSVSPVSSMIGTEQPKRPPDLCSWSCVAVYAAERAAESHEHKAYIDRTVVAASLRGAAQMLSPIGAGGSERGTGSTNMCGGSGGGGGGRG